MSSLPTERIPRPSGSSPARGALRTSALLGGAAVGILAAIAVLPDRLGVDHRTPFVQIVAFRPQIVAAALLLALLTALWAWRNDARGWPAAAALALVAVIGLAVVVPRATASSTPAAGGTTLQVLSLNTYLGQADPDALADLVRDRSPDLVALPEAGGELRRRLEARLDDDAGGTGYRSFVADTPEDESPMTVFVKRTLGRPAVSTDRAGRFPAIVVDLPGAGVRFVAVHPQSPKPGDTRQWVRDVGLLQRWCTAGRPTIVAGDMNATLDHAEFRDATAGCVDAAASVGGGLPGTWPTEVPRVLGAQIDHVLLSGGPTATAVDVVDVPGSDHRAVLAGVRVG